MRLTFTNMWYHIILPFMLLSGKFCQGTGSQDKLDCRSNLSGGNYEGNISVTKSGQRCQRWDQQLPHAHNVTKDMLLDGDLSLAENYCRSPDFDPGGPWCFTLDKNILWDYCEIPVCDSIGCLDTVSGVNYIGHANTSGSGAKCGMWSNIQKYTLFGIIPLSVTDFAGNNIDHNFCRNPLEGKEKPWCYLMKKGDEDTQPWEYCDIPLCERLNIHTNATILPEKMCTMQGGFCTSEECCRLKHYVSNLCQYEDKVCCMSEPDCHWREVERAASIWPEGNYGILMSLYGCPHNADFTWHRGILKLTSTVGSIKGNLTSDVLMFLGPYNERSITLNLCLRDEEFTPGASPWPKGSYCLFKYKASCPQGFKAETLEAKSLGSKLGTTLEYNKTCDEDEYRFCVHFCCRNNQPPELEIILPNKSPFYLLKYGLRCQAVRNMEAMAQVVHVIIGPDGDTKISMGILGPIGVTEDGFIMELCLYKSSASDTCYDPIDDGYFYRGAFNITTNGVCAYWSDVPRTEWTKFYDYVGMDGSNNCLNVLVFEFEKRPWCFANGRKVLCDIPQCENDWDSLLQMGHGRPARQTIGGFTEAEIAVDGIIATCSRQALAKAWWQLDLQGWYAVHGVRIHRESVENCVVRLANMYVGVEPDDFKDSGALLCANNFSIGASPDVMIKCKQPTVGRYITLENLVYVKYESFTRPYEVCLEMCEVVAYVKDTGCGRRLLERSRGNTTQTIITTSDGQRFSGKDLMVLNSKAWCGNVDNQKNIWIKVNLLMPYRVQGIETQGSQTEESMVTSFTVEYGMTESELFPYQEYHGVTKIFENDPKYTSPKLHRFMNAISLRILYLKVLSYKEQPCFRIEIIGCINNYVEVLQTGTKSQSSTFGHQEADLGTDGSVLTCSETQVENSTWWQTRLPKLLHIHSMLFETGIANPWNLVARRKAVAISEGWQGNASYVVDGNANTIYHEGSCSHTLKADYAWWSSELATSGSVSRVMITTRLDCCVDRIRFFSVYIGDVPPEPGTPLNRSHYQFCTQNTESFNPGETKTVHCEKPLEGKYLIMINDIKESYNTMCELQAYGNRVPFLVLTGREPAPVLTSRGTGMPCDLVAAVPVGGFVHTFRCGFAESADFVVLSVGGEGPITVCSASAYGGFQAGVHHLSSGRSSVNVTCTNQHQIHVEYFINSTGINEGSLRVRQDQLPWILDNCEAQETCIIPVSDEAVTMDTMMLDLYCSIVEDPALICHEEIDSESLIQTPYYPAYYGQDVSCDWFINAPPGKFVALNVTDIRLPAPVKPYRDGCAEVNEGNCPEGASLFFDSAPRQYIMKDEDELSEIKTLSVTNPALYISDSNILHIKFRSCYRNVGQKREWEEQLGLRAIITFQDCQGCHSQSKDTLLECSGKCGQVTSRGFPHSYNNNERTIWTILVEEGHFITLTFYDFDVYERPLAECLKDYVEVQDVDLSNTASTVGRFCNSAPPRRVIKSSWAKLIIQFTTDSVRVGRGFHALYQQQKNVLDDDFPSYGYSNECLPNWTRFMDSCYFLYTWHHSLTWAEAEDHCKAQEGHLVAIANKQEMVFIHYMLTTEWQTEFYRTFIGLNDKEVEGKWQWADGSPVIFTDWALTSDYENVQQPDGAEVEDCAMIRLDSIHDTHSWHDIPCAYDKVQQFLCEIEIKTNSTIGAYDKDLDMMFNSSITTPRTGLLQCENGEYILEQLWCDGRHDCHDRSDENDCYSSTEGGETCSEWQFKCRDGSCISITLYCDYKSDCPDGSDEESCVLPTCNGSEFRCDNGQCISTHQRCDILFDCHDKSDEADCDRCAEGTTFQCFDGSCIPDEKRCDSVVDCPGALHEDESSQCYEETAEPSCLDWKVAGKTLTGRYRIQPPGVDGFDVECDMTSDKEYVLTIMHHTLEEDVYVSGYNRPGDYLQMFDYGLTKEQFEVVKDSSVKCNQYLQIRCEALNGLLEDWFLDINGEKIPFVDKSDDYCKCLFTSSCSKSNKGCHCSGAVVINPRRTTVDEDYLELENLPITGLTLSGTGLVGLQYQYYYLGPLICYQYANKTQDDFQCDSGQWIPVEQHCVSKFDKYGDPVGCRDMSHLQSCSDMQCGVGELKCNEGYCIGLHSVCDGVKDCMAGEDEVNCVNFTCKGSFRCLAETTCVSLQQRCDGIKQCSHGNDEWHCDIDCPSGCQCMGLAFKCQNMSLMHFPSDLSHEARKIDFSHNTLIFQNKTFQGFSQLGELVLRQNKIMEILPRVFRPLVNLYMLDLSYNDVKFLGNFTFMGLSNLRTLILVGNMNIKVIYHDAFAGLDKLINLPLDGLGLEEIKPRSFDGLTEIKSLNLANNRLVTFDDVFTGLSKLMELNATGNPDMDVSRDEFSHLTSLMFLYTGRYKYCCFVADRVSVDNCLPKPDEFSSCEDLMSRDILKVFLWVLGLIAFVCNLFVLIYRKTEKMNVYSFSVMNLAVADFLMGVYMVVLASVDAYYRGVYIEYADQWTGSILCQILGFLNTLSSECSVFTLCVISADRFYKIVFPLQASKFGMRKAKLVMVSVWCVALILAALPLLPIPYFGGGYYGKSSVCISIYLTRDQSPGWQFSIGIFHGLNFVCFMMIFFGYSYLFHVIRENSKETKSFTNTKNVQSDIALARRLTLVVFTDFLCWVPINMMGAMAGAGVAIPGEVYAWVVVFLLPINSAINPLLYTISSIQLQRKRSKANETLVPSKENSTTLAFLPDSKAEMRDLKTYLASYQSLPLPMVYKITRDIAKILADLHNKGLSSPNMDPTNLFVETIAKGDPHIALSFCAGDITSPPEDDILAFGKLTSHLLRRLVPVPGNKGMASKNNI